MQPRTSSTDTTQLVKPFLRWAGGKWRFVRTIVQFFPPRTEVVTYFEPFVGSGAAFLSYQPSKAVLSDLNEDLMLTFEAVKRAPSTIHRYLQEFQTQECEAFYYRTRDLYNSSTPTLRNAARLIYLNKACFNGIYRVNTEGRFNVPYGYRRNLNLPTLEELQMISTLLESARLVSSDFRTVLKSAKKGDLVYLDPPYPPLNGTSFFAHYTKERFGPEQQEDLAALADRLATRGCHVVISNADTKAIRSLYAGWSFHRIARTRYVTAALTKHKVNELIIRNI